MALTKVTGSVIKDSVSLSGNVSVGGTLTYQDVTNVDALGIGTFRSGINVSGGQLDVGSNIKLGNAGVITATSFVGSGANLTGITQTTINNNADNRVITGSGSANTLEGEATLTFDTTNGLVCDSGTVRCNNGFSSDVDLILNADANNNGTGSIIFKESGSEKARITSDGKMGLGTSSVDELLHVANTGGGASILIETNASSGGNILFGDNSSNTVGRIQYVHSDNSMRFNTDGAEKLRIDSSGRLLVGSAAVTYNQSPLYVSGTDPVVATFHHSDGGTNDQARIALGALVNNPPFNRGVYLTAKNNGNGHDFIVATSASHAAGPSEKFRITSTGVIETGTAVGGSGYDSNMVFRIGRAGDCNLAIRNTANTTSHTGIDFGDSGDDRSGRIQYMHNGDYMSFHTNGAGSGTSNERLRITSDGYLQQHKLIAVSYSDTRGISLSNADLTTSNFYNTTFFASDSTILDSNGHFVAPVHGIYRLYFRCTTDGSNGNRANVRLRKNGNTINEAYGGANDSNDYMSVSSEIVMELNAGEYLDIQVGQLHTLSGSQHKQVTFTMLG